LLFSALATSAQKVKESDDDQLVKEANDLFWGLAGKVDERKAFQLYEKAAKKKHPVALAMVGWMIHEGLGTKKDEDKGEDLLVAALPGLKKAAEAGNLLAMTRLGVMYETGHGIDKDEKQALLLYRKAAEKGEPVAMLNLGAMYEEGRGVAKSAK